MAPATTSAIDALVEELRERNYDQYLCGLYIPERFRPACQILDLFDTEISQLNRRIREPAAGEIRIQWWREVVHGERDGDAKSHPLATKLLDVIGKHDLSLAAFDEYLDGRVFDLYHDPVPDVSGLEFYCGQTNAMMFRLKLQTCVGSEVEQHSDLCGFAGMAKGVVDILQMLPFARASGRTYAPIDLINASGLSTGEWLETPPDQRHWSVADHMCDLADGYFNRFEELIPSADVFSVFLPLVFSREYLIKFRGSGLVVFDAPPEILPLKKHWILWRAARNNRI